MIKFYYSPELNILEDYRIIPPPKISIQQNLNYNNDVIVSYTYSIDLEGYATNYVAQYIETVDESGNLSTENSNEITTENDIVIITELAQITTTVASGNIQDINGSLPRVLYSIDLIKSILSRNGSNLTIRDTQNNNLLVAKHGTLKSLSFTNTNNNWSKFATYNATIEFNELLFFDEPITCSSGYINPLSITSGLIDINENHIKSFNEGWSFNIEDTALNYSTISDNNYEIKVLNTSIGVSYNISANGGNYWFEDKTIPGWLYAKNFAQKRLYDQVTNLSSILALSSQSGCSPINTLSTINNLGSGLFNNIATNYGLFNETITCDTSESDGTFNLTYNAILKVAEDDDFSDPSVIHKFEKEYSVNKEGTKNTVSISINGTIEGLCSGGIVSSSGNFSLPNQGTFIIKANNNTKFINATNFLPKIIQNNDLVPFFKESLGISSANLFVSGVCITGVPPSNFTLTKNFMDGNISYSVEYDTDRVCSTNGTTSITDISINIDNPTPIIAEIIVPKGDYIIQDIGTVTAKNVSVSVEGKTNRNCCAINDINSFISGYCVIDLDNLISGFDLPDEDTIIIRSKNFSFDPINGTYTLELSYTCSSGCLI